ncbi:hypothetical protein BCAH1134_C0199 (plasmid) [Bacillus cereus AH1134]|nr:hypothetical protein BCAH1134_C0199 [Bacillus cereus AH1134]
MVRPLQDNNFNTRMRYYTGLLMRVVGSCAMKLVKIEIKGLASYYIKTRLLT